MYADDTSSSTLVRGSRDIEAKVLPDLIKITDWLIANKLSLNVFKIGTTQVLSRIGNLLAVRVNGELIRRVYKSKYLGLIVDDKLSWKDHIDLISSKIRRNIGVMKRVRENVPGEILILLYRTLSEPYLRYCNTTWGYCGVTLLNRLQALQNRAARLIKGLKYAEADYPKILSELGILNVEQLVRLDTTSLVYRIKIIWHLNNYQPFSQNVVIFMHLTPELLLAETM